MARYDYRCDDHGTFEVEKPMAEAGREEICPVCEAPAKRVFMPVTDIWHTDGAHKTDYFKGNTTGSKGDKLRKNYERIYGEPAPPPAPDVPRNAKDRY